MHIIINALSVTNTSGRHVLMGHFRQVTKWTESKYKYTFLYHDKNVDMIEDLGPHVNWVKCPPNTSQWFKRTQWERSKLPSLAKELNTDCLFTPAGVASPTLEIPQIVFCQNPWCLVPAIHNTIKEKAKAKIQRYAYKQAMKKAHTMVFNSTFMQKAYELNAGFKNPSSWVIYQGINPSTFDAAKNSNYQKIENQILTVSAMGNHKGVETVVRAIKILKDQYGITVSWKVIGAWPDPGYKDYILNLITELKISDQVNFCGHVSLEELNSSYAQAKVFCLMSQCESFGIPAIEAQTFGTPVVTANSCAMPEIDGEGGLYPEPNNPDDTAEALHQILTDNDIWNTLSKGALANAAKYHWTDCSSPFIEVFEKVENERNKF